MTSPQIRLESPAPAQKQPLDSYFSRADHFMEKGDLTNASKLLQDAVRFYPHHAGIAWRLADIDFRNNNAVDAKKRITTALKKSKGRNAYFYCAGIRLARAMKETGLAAKLSAEGLKQTPLFPELHYQAGILYIEQQQFDKACDHLETAINLQPSHGPALTSFGYALEQLGNTERAEIVLRHAIARRTKNYRPNTILEGDFTTFLNLANVLHKRGKLEEALWLYRSAFRAQPRAYILSNLGALLRKMHRFDEAVVIYKQALTLDPGNSGAFYNYANLLKETGPSNLASTMYRRAIAADPDNASLHWNLSLSLLTEGRLEEGFEEYEWRWQYDGFPSRGRDFKQPMWDGTSFEGKTLLVHAEQGMGDHLQFARYIPLIAEKGGHTVVECHGPLLRLFEGYAGKVELVERLSPPEAFDLHIPLLSAPRALGTKTLDNLPKQIPYLVPPKDAHFDIPEARDGALKVAIIWGGNPQFSGDKERSTNLDYYYPLLKLDGLQLFSVQKGDREPELKNAPPEIVRLSDRIEDFCDTASIMTQMDLTITTCTSTAHLAGALGVPFWVLLSHNPDWRWLRDRDDSPWYPTARLFRQDRPGDWVGVFERVKKALEERLKEQ